MSPSSDFWHGLFFGPPSSFCVSSQVTPHIISLIRNFVVFFLSFPFVVFLNRSLSRLLIGLAYLGELLEFTEVSFFLHFGLFLVSVFSDCSYSTVLIGVATWDTFNFKERWQCCKLHEYFQWICEENKSNRINILKWWICEQFLFPIYTHLSDLSLHRKTNKDIVTANIKIILTMNTKKTRIHKETQQIS